MRKYLSPFVLAGTLAACSTSGGLASKYQPMTITGGYQEKQIEPGLWLVTGRSNGMAEPGDGERTAIYRAAEIMKAGGFSHMQIVDQKGQKRTIVINNVPGPSGGESLDLWVRGTNDPAAPIDCRAKLPSSCSILEVAAVLARLGPQLVLPTKAP